MSVPFVIIPQVPQLVQAELPQSVISRLDLERRGGFRVLMLMVGAILSAGKFRDASANTNIDKKNSGDSNIPLNSLHQKLTNT